MDDVIPYTHWAYFDDEAAARRCAEESLQDYVTRIQRAADSSQWLLLAGRDVPVSKMVERHAEVRAVVERHGGVYDGGESTWLQGDPVADPMLTGDWPTLPDERGSDD